MTPGVIDTHSHLGVYAAPGIESLQDGNELTNPNTAEVSSEHAIWPQDPQFELALAGGVTTMHILPGSGNLFGGRSVTVKNVRARTADDMKFPGAPYGLKMACGENPMRIYGSRNTAPSTRMGNVAGYRKAWQAATEYRDRWRKWKTDGSDPSKRPDRNLQLETLMGVLDGEIRIQNHCYRADEMATMIDISKEFGFKIASFHHAVEAYKIRDLLAANDICASMWADWWGFKLEAYDGITQNIALVHEAGACAIVHSDSADGIQRLNQEAAKAIRAGAEAGITISRADAVKWLTINPAKALGIEKMTGSLEPGKNADVVIWSGDPFSAYAHADRVFIDGVQVFDRADTAGAPRSDFQLGILPTFAKASAGQAPSAKASAGPVAAAAVRSVGVTTAPRVVPNVPQSGESVAVINARILPVVGAPIERGTIVIRGGRIAAVGANVSVPAGARVVDAQGKTVTPGLIDSGIQTGTVEIPSSAEGTADQNTTDARVSAAFNVVDAFNGNSAVIPVTRVEGITRALITPGGTNNVFAGQGAVMDFSGAQVPASVTRAPAAMLALLGEQGAASRRVQRGAAPRLLAQPGGSGCAAAGPEGADSACGAGEPRERPARGTPSRRRIQAAAGDPRRIRRMDGCRAACESEGASGREAADEYSELRFAGSDARERGAAVARGRDGRARVVRHAERAQPAAGSGQRDRQRHGPRRGAGGRDARAGTALGRRGSRRLDRSGEGRGPRRVGRRSVRAHRRRRARVHQGR